MIVIVGGGVVGLAAARALAERGRAVCVVERHARLGQDTSTHNSGVIHAGLYYPPGSLKEQLRSRRPLNSPVGGLNHVPAGLLRETP